MGVEKELTRVLVTGGAGFIGSHVVEELLHNGYQVIVLDNLSRGSHTNIPKGVSLYNVDVSSSEVAQIFEAEKPDAVIHQAAQVSVPSSIRDPLFDARVNITGTINILQQCIMHEIQKFVFASSAAVYGAPERLPILETHKINPISPYGLSKHTSERYIQMLCKLGNLRYTILRYSNVYGPRQDPAGEAGVVSIFKEALEQEQQPQIFGSGEQTRDFVYVKDVARANVASIQQNQSAIFNISSGTAISIKELFAIMASVVKSPRTPRHTNARDGDIQDSLLDNSLAKGALDWYPLYSLHDGLAEMLSWSEASNATTDI